LLQLQYAGKATWICPQCLPTLIHAPARLADKLPGIEHIKPATHKDH
jgi:hypothetical protein